MGGRSDVLVLHGLEKRQIRRLGREAHAERRVLPTWPDHSVRVRHTEVSPGDYFAEYDVSGL